MTAEEQHQIELERKEDEIYRNSWLNYGYTEKVLLDLAERRQELLRKAEEFSQIATTHNLNITMCLARSKEIDRIIHLLKTGEYE